MATSRARLRASHRRVKGHDSRRHGGQSHAQKRSSVIFQTGSHASHQIYLLFPALPKNSSFPASRRSLTFLNLTDL